MANESQERSVYYLSRRQTGHYLNQSLAFYPGAASIPQSFTANHLFMAGGAGPGAKILNGIGPVPASPCDPPVIVSLLTAVAVNLSVTVIYNVEPGDVYVLFNTMDGTHLPLISVTPVLGGMVIEFDDTSPPATPGMYTFKIIRSGQPGCFAVRSKAFMIAPPPCLISLTTIVGPGVFPNPPIAWGDLGVVIALTGFGFLSGPLAVTITNTGLPFNLLDITSVVVIDDNNMTVTFDATTGGVPVFGSYDIKVSLAADPFCFDTIGSITVIVA